ncbi:MAG: hypothetical protein ACXVXI_03995 [Mycobacteriaceae bacterium]
MLQNQLASTLREAATPGRERCPPTCTPFHRGLRVQRQGGTEVGRSNAAALSGVLAEVAAKIHQVGLQVFQQGCARAMNPTGILPNALCLLATRHTNAPQAQGPATSPTVADARAAITEIARAIN